MVILDELVRGEQEAARPRCGSMIVSSGEGCMQSTIAPMSARGVKY